MQGPISKMQVTRKPRFSGHQTFTFRYGWLEKGYRFAKEGKSFADESAIVDLGVGKNMVESIKYWCEMMGILEDGKVTEFADRLLDENDGWDPFLEDDASLWLLHWKMATNPIYLTAGSILFSFLHKPEFSRRDVAEAISYQFRLGGKKSPTDQMLLRDIDCYLRAYAGTKRYEKIRHGEDSFGCPFYNLDVVIKMNDAEMYRFYIGPKISLPAEIIGYAIWDYLRRNKSSETLRIQEALYHEFSPGQVFMLDENSLIEAVESLKATSPWENDFDFTESAGIALIRCSIRNGDDLLEKYFRQGRS